MVWSKWLRTWGRWLGIVGTENERFPLPSCVGLYTRPVIWIFKCLCGLQAWSGRFLCIWLIWSSLHLVNFAYLPNMGKYKWVTWSQEGNLHHTKQHINLTLKKKKKGKKLEEVRKTEARICNLVPVQFNWNLPLNGYIISYLPTPWWGWKTSMGFCHLFYSDSELHNWKTITYFFASSTLPKQLEYLLIQLPGYSFINSLLVSYPAKTHSLSCCCCFFAWFFFPLRSQCLHRYFKEITILRTHPCFFSSHTCKSPDWLWNYCIHEDTEKVLSLSS